MKFTKENPSKPTDASKLSYNADVDPGEEICVFLESANWTFIIKNNGDKATLILAGAMGRYKKITFSEPGHCEEELL
jgi:hypothetical protein